MNQINNKPLTSLGYGFIAKEHIPKGKNEYHLRNIQNRSGNKYRKITASEKKILLRNGNSADNWDKFIVTGTFYPDLIKNCKFYGLIRIGQLEPLFAEFNDLQMPVGLYNSTIISCDIGNNVVIDNVNFMSHYIIENNVMLVNINELVTSNHAKFGNGVLKDGENESVRIWMEVCNENAGRSILPVNGMKAADAWLWSKYRDDEKLLHQFKTFTDKKFDTQRGYYGKIGDRTVIKNTSILKDVWIGSDAYIKGANKLKNLTINSSANAKSQIGEGCELVNGIIGFGCRIFYGVKAVRFMMGSNSQLKYGARLINSFLGDNSTISCCEVLNSLIFSAHEQHHNNSFLCAATVMGQSNMAAGATIGSNHNSRGADGELIAGRGFWPALCVSLKHNSKFASFTLIAKGDFPAELNIPIPFSLVSNDLSKNEITVMPGYWFLYNMYALVRNAEKYKLRDKRMDKTQEIEYGFLAPDSINEMFDGLQIMRKFTAKAYSIKSKKRIAEKDYLKIGEQLLTSKTTTVAELKILASNFENSDRSVSLIKVKDAYPVFKKMIVYYGVTELIRFIEARKITSWQKLDKALPPKAERNLWKNIGGQLIPQSSLNNLINSIRSGKINSWEEVHNFYNKKSSQYTADKLKHAYGSLLEILNLTPGKFTRNIFIHLLKQAINTSQWITEEIHRSREKDYQNNFRQMVYDNTTEMEQVIGKLSDNIFLHQQDKVNEEFCLKVNRLIQQFSQ